MPVKLTLIREETGDQGTFGHIMTENTRFATAELPWKDNKPNISCIPEGEYRAVPNYSPRFKQCYKLLNVTGRTNILIHTGNWAGDVSMGYKSDVEGCILIGETLLDNNRQKMVTNSRRAFIAFRKLIGDAEFILEIKNMWQGGDV